MGRQTEGNRRDAAGGGTKNVSEVKERGLRHVVSITNTIELSPHLL